jgi:uncharacterized protein YbaP (TraB family)
MMFGVVFALSIACSALAQGASASAAAVRHGFLYRIERDGIAPSWLLGTLHSADPRVLALIDTPALARITGTVRTLAIEMQAGPGDDAQLAAGAELADGERLDALLGPDTWDGVRLALDGGGDAARLVRLKPWAILLALAEAPRTQGIPLDAQLRERARERRVSVLGLELPEEQVAAFDAVPVASQVELVRYALAHRSDMLGDHERAVQAWLAGDAFALQRIARAPVVRDARLAPHFAALERSIVTGRTALFAHRLFVPLRAGRVLVAVGASHLDGPDGLVALLSAQGYRVRPLPWPR